MKRFGLIVLAGGLLTAGAQAQETNLEPKPISTQAIYACAEISDDMERLACYDESVGRLEAAEAAGEVTTISKAEVEEIERDSFGFSLPSIARNVLPKFGNDDGEKLAELEVPVESVRRLSYGNLRVALENGQVWEQTDSQRVNYSKKNGVESAEIKRAALGSFKMKLDGGRAFRVKRVK
ncbi:MAG: hypothetical protein AAGL11_01190 [Pseudomonadota bacterium]